MGRRALGSAWPLPHTTVVVAVVRAVAMHVADQEQQRSSSVRCWWVAVVNYAGIRHCNTTASEVAYVWLSLLTRCNAHARKSNSCPVQSASNLCPCWSVTVWVSSHNSVMQGQAMAECLQQVPMPFIINAMKA